jgi:hypothetical protein
MLWFGLGLGVLAVPLLGSTKSKTLRQRCRRALNKLSSNNYFFHAIKHICARISAFSKSFGGEGKKERIDAIFAAPDHGSIELKGHEAPAAQGT